MPKKSNAEIGKIAENVVFAYLKKHGSKPVRAAGNKGYDIKAGRTYYEVKGTEQSFDELHYFNLTRTEYRAAMDNKFYWICWVSIKDKKPIFIPRDYILKNVHKNEMYWLYLSKYKKQVKR